MTVQLTQEQFQELLGRISAIHSSANKNFTQCTLRFYGECDNNKVEIFISAVSAFKQREQIPDEDALFGLPLLLKGAASTWWAEVRSEVNSWQEALDRIRLNYASKAPPHEIYMQIFANPQGNTESFDKFLNSKKQLLALLPTDRHSEEVQLDLIYGLLKLDLRKKIHRKAVKTFAELEENVRRLESWESSAKLTKSIQPSIKKQPKKRCSFCRYKGHTVEVCKKRMLQMAEELNCQPTVAGTWKTSAKLKADSPMSPTSTVDLPMSPTPIVTDSPASPPAISDSPASPPPTATDSPASPPILADSSSTIARSTRTVPMVFSHMSPTTDDEEPSIFCFGCGAPNVWKSICAKCKNT